MISSIKKFEVEDIESNRLSFASSSGSLIVGYLDEGQESNWNGRFIVLTPKYGETKKNTLRMSYFLVANGFKVLRFDHTNHVGESDGDMINYTLPGAVVDILDVVQYVDTYFEPEEIILISNSLSARAAYRAAAEDDRISRIASVVGVVNLQQTIKDIYQKDIIGTHCEGQDWGTIDILGFDIDSANFISELVDKDMNTLEGTLKDAAKIKRPLLHLHAAKDLWVNREQVELVVNRAGGQLIEIEGAYHEIGESPAIAQQAMELVTRFCLDGLKQESTELYVPSKVRLFDQNKKERNRLKQLYVVKETEDDFWGNYLGDYSTMEDAKVYIDYFDKVGALLGSIGEGEVVIDAGCGNGFFGLSIIHSLEASFGLKSDFPKHFFYCGLDLTPAGLDESFTRQSQLRSKLLAESYEKTIGASFAYQKFDFNRIEELTSNQNEGRVLSFADGSVDKICCSLVLSYLKTPLLFLRELHRILKPGGVAVISSMKPDCDMTVLYHDFITSDCTEAGKAKDAQKLLGSAGKIKLKEQSGIYEFFTESALLSITEEAGFRHSEFFRSLGNQANIVRVIK